MSIFRTKLKELNVWEAYTHAHAHECTHAHSYINTAMYFSRDFFLKKYNDMSLAMCYMVRSRDSCWQHVATENPAVFPLRWSLPRVPEIRFNLGPINTSWSGIGFQRHSKLRFLAIGLINGGSMGKFSLSFKMNMSTWIWFESKYSKRVNWDKISVTATKLDLSQESFELSVTLCIKIF